MRPPPPLRRRFVDNMQRTPVSAAGIMRSLPPHLRSVFGARALLPRIGGAAFMDLDGPLHTQGAETMVAVAGLGKQPAAAAAVVRADGSAAAAVAVAGGDGAVAVASGSGAPQQLADAGKSPRHAPLPPRSLPAGSPAPLSPAPSPRPVSPQRPSSGGGTPRQLPAGRARSGATTPQGAGSSMHGSVSAGYLLKQGSLGASLVAEALRQEIAAQLASAAAVQAGGSGPANRRRERSRSLSPLPSARQAGSSRHSLAGQGGDALAAAAAARPSPFVADAPAGALGRQSRPAQPATQAQAQQRTAPEDVPGPIFPGLRRSRSDAAQSVSSGAATPRLVVPLQAPPPRRSTNLSQRVQEQARAG